MHERRPDAPAAWWECQVCGRLAGRVELEDRTGSVQLRRITFTGLLTQPVSAEAAARLGRALAAGDAAALHAMDPELVPFYCPACDATYCGDHVQRWDVFDEDGMHDSIRGRCPAGHERMLED
jgi:hypothetical protein